LQVVVTVNTVYRGVPVTQLASYPPNIPAIDFYSGAIMRQSSASVMFLIDFLAVFAGDVVVYNFTATNNHSLLQPYDVKLRPSLLIITTATSTDINTNNPWASKLTPESYTNNAFVSTVGFEQRSDLS
jgi:hypothetical protein